jgi:glycosyltransferase involved in cell wall biosynthesis
LLFVGDRSGYKNFRLPLEAMTRRDFPRGMRLAVVGNPFSLPEELLVARLGLQSAVLHHGRVDDTRLRQLYGGAAALVSPSLCEGFGFPLLEAQSLRAPVLCSDIPVYHETGGDSVLYFDPVSPAALAAAAQRVLDPALADDLQQRGTANLARFTWARCAQLTLDAYRDLAAGAATASPTAPAGPPTEVARA